MTDDQWLALLLLMLFLLTGFAVIPFDRWLEDRRVMRRYQARPRKENR